MTTLANLGAHADGALIAQSQAQKEVTSNALDTLLSNATQKLLSLAVTLGSPAELTLTADQFFGSYILHLTGSPGADFQLKVPPGGSHSFVVDNATANRATVVIGAGTSVDVEAGKRRLLHSNGSAIVALAPEHTVSGAGGGGGASTAFFADLDAWFAGQPTAGQVIRRWVMTRKIVLPADFAGSQGFAGTAPSDGAAIFELVHENGASPSPGVIGTMSFALGARSASFANAGSPGLPVTLNPGDTLELRAPNPADAALADLSVRLKGDAGFRAALVRKTANQSINNATATALTFDAEEYDTDGFHSTVSNTSRMTVPAGASRVRLYGGVRFAGSSADTKARAIHFRKNGAQFNGGTLVNIGNGGTGNTQTILSIASAPLAVAGGDYLELFARQDSGGALNVESAIDTYIGIEVVE